MGNSLHCNQVLGLVNSVLVISGKLLDDRTSRRIHRSFSFSFSPSLVLLLLPTDERTDFKRARRNEQKFGSIDLRGDEKIDGSRIVCELSRKREEKKKEIRFRRETMKRDERMVLRVLLQLLLDIFQLERSATIENISP